MADISLIWDPAHARGDWQVEAGQITIGGDLETAVLVSLFTDRVLPPDAQSPDRSTDPRGWWADTYRGQPIGSLLWTLSRAVKTSATALLSTVQGMCQDALAWLISDGVAATISVKTFWESPTMIGIIVVITESAGNVSTFKYSWAWNGIN